jgi:hypothetical protein
MSLETLARPLAAVIISQDGVNAIAFEQSDELDNDVIRAVNRLARNEAFHVGAKLRQKRGCRGGGIALERPIDDFRRQRRIEIAAGALSNKDLGIALRAVVPVVNAPHLTASCIGRGDGPGAPICRSWRAGR